jgi:hypothetical protein
VVIIAILIFPDKSLIKMLRPSKSKSFRVPTLSPEHVSDINLITWSQIGAEEEAEVVIEKCVNEILNSVESFVGGEFHQKSSCSIITLSPKKAKEENLTEDNRLMNWKRWIKIREKQSDKIRKFTQRRRQEMLINLNPNDYREILNRKDILEKSAAGFGALNFWKLPEKSRKDLHLTLPNFERVNQHDIVFAPLTPDLILKEQHIARAKSPTEIVKLLQSKFDQEIKIPQPSMKHLALKGNVLGDGLEHPQRQSLKDSIRLSFKPEKIEEIKRPQVLQISNIKIDDNFPDVNIHIDLNFKAFKMQRTTKILRLENLGMVAIDVKFKKIHVCETVNLSSTIPSSFFFDKSSFRITPEEIVEVPFHFYTSQIGVHFKKLNLTCNPPFSKECEICISLFGHCTKKFKSDASLKTLSAEVELKTMEINVDQSLKGVSLLGFDNNKNNCQANLSEDQFIKMNPKFQYLRENVKILKQIFDETCEDQLEWNYDVDTLQKTILEVKELYKQEALNKKFIENLAKLRNSTVELTASSEMSEKFSLVRDVFKNFLGLFEGEITQEEDQTLKHEFYNSINYMINILES